MTKEWLIFALGTNNWQRPGQFASGSGILHEGLHAMMNTIPGCQCFSMWPSDILKTPTDREDYRVYEIPFQVPICESVGPHSSKRWHSMSEEQILNYCDELQDQVIDYIDYVENKTGKRFNLFLAHHTFMNPVIMVKINRRRVAAGLPSVPIAVFAHGTALKMYQNELNKLPDFPMRFYNWICGDVRLFEGDNEICAIFTVSNPQKEIFQSVFPNFPKEHVIVAPCGFNHLEFYRDKDMTRQEAFASLPQVLYEGFDIKMVPYASKYGIGPNKTIPNVDDYDKVVIFCGRFADWKRPDAVLYAASKWEKENEKILTLMVGGGSVQSRMIFVDLAYSELELKHTYFLGPQRHDVLARIYNVSDLGIFPSKDEPFGLVFIECMGCGTPVIGAKSGGPLDFVNDNVGALVDEGDIEKVSAGVYDAVMKGLREDWKKHKGPICEQYTLERFTPITQCKTILGHVEEHFFKNK